MRMAQERLSKVWRREMALAEATGILARAMFV